MADSRIGVSIMCGTFPGPEAILDLIRRLDAETEVGAIYLTESGNDAMTLAGAAAAVTHRAELGTAIAVTYLRHPWELANGSINVDRLSGGRFTLGLGTGHHPTIEGRLGLSFGKPVSRMRDFITVVREALDTDGAPTTTRTEHFQNSGAAPLWRPAHRLPIVVAALGDPMTRMAGTVADGIITSVATRGQIRRFRSLLDAAAEAAGRDPAAIRILTVMHTVIRPTRQAAREVMRQGLKYTGMPFYQREYAREGLSAPGGVPDDATIDAISIAGPLDYAREQAAAWLDAGVDLLLLADTYNEPDPTTAYLTFSSLAT